MSCHNPYRPTPYSITICILIQINNTEDPHSHTNEVLGEILTHKNTVLVSHWNAFYSTYHARLGDDVCAKLENTLQRIALQNRNPDGLIDLFVQFENLLEEPVVDRDCLHGLYLRRNIVGFDALSFEAVGQLWRLLRLFVQNNSLKDEILQEESSCWPVLSDHDVRLVVQRLCEKFDKVNFGDRAESSYVEMEAQIAKWIIQYPTLPSLHFLRCLNCLQHGERVGALDHFHRYFDYAVIHERRQSSKLSTVRRYTAVVLAALYHALNDKSLAREATEEAVRISQQYYANRSGDHASIAYALNWLYLYNFHPEKASEVQGDETLRRCFARARDHNLHALSLKAALSLTRAIMSPLTSQEFENPCQAWSTITATLQPSTIRNNIQISSSRPNVSQVQSSLALITNSDNERDDIISSMASRHIVASSLCNEHGRPATSSLESIITLHCHGKHLSTTEFCSAISNICGNILNGSCRDLAFSRFSDEGYCLSLDGLNIYPDTSQSSSVYSQALRSLKTKERKGDRMHILKVTSTILMHEWAVRRNDFAQACALSCDMNGLVMSLSELQVQVLGQHGFRLMRQKSWNRAKSYFESACSLCESEPRLYSFRAQFLLELALIDMNACPKHPLNALPFILECLSISERMSMDYQHAAANVMLGQLYLLQGTFSRARTLILSVLPIVCQHCSLFIQGLSFLILAKSNLQDANRGTGHPKKRLRLLRLCLNQLDEAAELFQTIDDLEYLRETYYLQARIYDVIPGRCNERNQAARHFRNLSSLINQNRKLVK